MDQHGKLDDLENQANDLRKSSFLKRKMLNAEFLEDAAGLFMERAEKVSDKYWFQNMKYTFALVAFLLLVVILFLWINEKLRKNLPSFVLLEEYLMSPSPVAKR